MVELPPFEALLRAAVDASDRRPILLPVLGLALRAQDPSFAVRRYGADKLKLLLAGRPDLGELVDVPGRGDAWQPAETTATTVLAAPTVRLQRALWLALTAPDKDAEQWRFDLAEIAVVRVQGEVANALQLSPERFLVLPHVTSEVEAPWRRAFLSEVIKWPDDDPLNPDDWSAFRERVHGLHRWRDWLDYRRGRIAGHALAWAKRHGVRAGSITAPLVPSRPQRAPSHETVSPAPRSSEELRRLVHRAVDLMQHEELAALPIPAGVMARAVAASLR